MIWAIRGTVTTAKPHITLCLIVVVLGFGVCILVFYEKARVGT